MPDTTTVTTASMSKKRSLSNTLTMLLVATVAAIAIAASSIIYIVLSRNEYARLEQKAVDFITSIDDVLEIPLWNLDHQNIEKIGQAYTADDLIERFRVIDNIGLVHFDLHRHRNAPAIEKAADIYHEGQIVGHIDMAYTTEGLVHRNRGLLLSGMGILVFVIFGLAMVTGMFLNSILGKLLHRLHIISDAYASGKEISPSYEMPYQEFIPLIRILRNMRDKLNEQFADIQLAEKKYRSIFENAVEGIYQSTPDGRFVDANPAMAEMLGYDSPEELIASISDIGSQLYFDPEYRKEYLRRTRTDGEVKDFPVKIATAEGGIAWLSLHSRPVYDENGELKLIEGMAQDITRQKQAEEDRQQLEQQLLHSQKLESVGRLAGGVAHDFNNMLNIILGYSDLLLEKASPTDPSYEQLREIKSAATRSADLTRQLLAFARKQTVSPKLIDLNKTVPGMMKMLERLLGENINLTFTPGENLGLVNIDPTQLDQILINLCINARDAITGTGWISITTEPIVLDDTYCRQHPDSEPGLYAVLSVSDSGCGMKEDVRKNIFEPFFTTKGLSKGTGLGLSTVYGIVKQNRGSIHVYSEVGYGTTFKVYLPEKTSLSAKTKEKAEADSGLNGNETILLVEDELSLLNLGRQTLTQLGYLVLATASPTEALRISREHPGEIQLMMTDVVMPEMNGQELANILSRERPAMRCLFVSGYTTDIIAPQGVLEDGVHFIQKPFTRKILANKLREILT